MQLIRFSVPLAAFVACFFSVARAHADVLTLGSNLSAPATIVQSHQADAAFWPTSIQGADPSVPADGQVMSVKVKGMVIQPQGAPAPLNEFHFQSLDKGVGDVMSVYLSSGPMDLPYTGDANQISTFTPVNLCIHQGGILDLNEEGGWDGTSDGPYKLGSPYRIFGRVANSTTDWYSADNGTKNGASLAPPNPMAGVELLMQYTLATGDDRSYECGGPLRDPDGSIHHDPPPDTRPKMNVILPQTPYVQSSGAVAVGVYCRGAAGCAGTAVMQVKGKKVGTAKFTIPPMKSSRIAMKISKHAFNALKKAKQRKQKATLVMNAGALGVFSQTLTIRH